ncbi:MAG: T9SS type A sorting domain-containing protein, partial [Fidelibacterota bacterium]
LHQNYPNPFNPVSTIRYDLPRTEKVSLVVYDIQGREVVRLVDSYVTSGFHEVEWDGRDANGREVPTGIYIARLVSPEYSRSIKMLLLK